MRSRPHLLLTRPRAQSERFAAVMRARLHGDIRITVAPLVEIVPLPLPAGLADAASGLVFTSENGVAAFAKGSARRDLTAWCVGPRTAQAARDAGFCTVEQAGGDAEALGARLRQAAPRGLLLHLRGRHVAADLAEILRADGIDLRGCVVYAQPARPLDPAALALLARPGTVVAPLFSARTACLLRDALSEIPLRARLEPVAISAAVARVWEGGSDPVRMPVSEAPNAAAMADVVAARIRALETRGKPR